VVCGPMPPNPDPVGRQLAEYIPEKVRIHRVSPWLATEGRARIQPPGVIAPPIDGGYMSAVALADRALQRLRTSAPTVVFATGPRFANFLAGRWLADAFAAKLVLQYRDEWTVNTPPFVQNSLSDRQEEIRCLEQADLVQFVSEAKKDLYCRAFPQLDVRKLVAIPNGWDSAFHQLARHDTRHLASFEGKFTLTYTGRWHASLQPLIDRLDALVKQRPDLAEKLCVVVVGNQLAANHELMENFQRRCPGVVVAIPRVPPTVAIEIQRESSALLLINEHIYDGVVPLKTFDYLNGARPVLVFGSTGGAADIVRRHGAGLVVDVDDDRQFMTALDTLMSAPPGGWDNERRRAWAAQGDRRLLVDRLLTLIEELPSDADADRACRLSQA